jgi:hypothetical protein
MHINDFHIGIYNFAVLPDQLTFGYTVHFSEMFRSGVNGLIQTTCSSTDSDALITCGGG